MKRRFLFLIAAVCAAVTTLTACEGNGLFPSPEGEEPHIHTYSEEWDFNSVYHWHSPDCGHDAEISDRAEHTFKDGVCVVCGYSVKSEEPLPEEPLPEDKLPEEQPIRKYTFGINAEKTGYILVSVDSVIERNTEIPAEYNGLPVTEIGNGAFKNCTFIESVTLSDGVKTIGSYAFFGCTNLREVILPASVTAIGDCAFYDCTALTAVNLSNGLESIGSCAFFNCAALNGIAVPESVTEILHCAFMNCTKLQTATLPDGELRLEYSVFDNTALSRNAANGALYIGKHLIKVSTNISGSYAVRAGTVSIAALAFENCTKLSGITMPDTVVNIGTLAFRNCNLLQRITLSNNLKFLGAMAFYGCNQIIYNYDGEIKYLGSDNNLKLALIGAESNEESFTVDSATKIIYYNAFKKAPALKEINLPASLKSVGEFAFLQCSLLQTVNYSGTPEEWSAVYKAPDSIPGGVTINFS